MLDFRVKYIIFQGITHRNEITRGDSVLRAVLKVRHSAGQVFTQGHNKKHIKRKSPDQFQALYYPYILPEKSILKNNTVAPSLLHFPTKYHPNNMLIAKL